MKKTQKLAMCFLLTAFLSSCSSGSETSNKSVALASEDYVHTLSNYHDGYKVLQLTDIHWNFYTDVQKESKYLTEVVRVANPDLIIITGDCILEANEAITQKLFETFDSWNIPFTLSWGNHDRQGIYPPVWLTNLATSCKNSLYKEVDDEVTGRCNEVINLTANNKTVWQIYDIDSNSFMLDSPTKYCYDYIHDDQTNWYTAQAEKAAQDNNNSTVPSLGFFHIPLWEWAYSYWDNNSNQKGTVIGEIGQESTNTVKGLTGGEHPTVPFWPSDTHSSFFEAAKNHGMKGMFCGHDHFNDWVNSYEGVTLGYGVKTGRGLEYTSRDGVEITGGAIYTLHTDKSFDIEHLFINEDTYKSSSTKKEGIL